MMTKEYLAALLNGREYGNEITKQEEETARKSGLVVIFGASDDLCELRGAIHDEVGSYQEALVLIRKDGKLIPEIEDGDTEVLKKYDALSSVLKAHEECLKVRAMWCAGPEYSWTYATTAPHATFDILEDGEKYCRGIVISLGELK